MVRLFVGGLAESITADLLEQRFVAFASVIGCEVIPPKPESTLVSPAASCRGFGFVDLDTADENVVRRCLNAYNNSKWRGHTLQVQPAKQHFLQTWKKEREQREREEEEEEKKQKLEAATEQRLLESIMSNKDNNSKLRRPQGKSVQGNRRKLYFPATEAKKLTQLCWDNLPPTEAILRKEAFVEEMQESYKPQKKLKSTKQANAAKASESRSSEELEAVDFCDNSEEITFPKVDDLGRFDDYEEIADAAPFSKQNSERLTKDIDSIAMGRKLKNVVQQPGPSSSDLLEIISDIRKTPQKSNALTSESLKDGYQEGRISKSSDSSSLHSSEGKDSSTSKSSLDGLSGEVSGKKTSEAPVSPEVGSQVAQQQETEDGTISAVAKETSSDGDGPAEATDLQLRTSDKNLNVTDSNTDAEAEIAALHEEFKAGAEFWNGHPGAVGLEASWLANREQLAANAKNKRKQALKYLMLHRKQKS